MRVSGEEDHRWEGLFSSYLSRLHAINMSSYCLFAFKYLFIWLHRVIVAACGIQLPVQGSKPALCIGSTESQPLGPQGGPNLSLFMPIIPGCLLEVVLARLLHHKVTFLLFLCYIFWNQVTKNSSVSTLKVQCVLGVGVGFKLHLLERGVAV